MGIPLMLVVVLTGGLMPLRARAALGSDGPTNTGNGRHNRNSVSVNSPTINHGIQHVTNTNIGGIANTQASFCKWKFRHCRISQRQKVFTP